MMIFPEHGGVNPVVAEVVRSGMVESRHRGAVAGLAADGTQVLSAGDTAVPFFPRSANKPLQATAMLRAGVELDGELLALAAASHSGEDYHVERGPEDLVRRRADRGRPGLPAILAARPGDGGPADRPR